MQLAPSCTKNYEPIQKRIERKEWIFFILENRFKDFDCISSHLENNVTMRWAIGYGVPAGKEIFLSVTESIPVLRHI